MDQIRVPWELISRFLMSIEGSYIKLGYSGYLYNALNAQRRVTGQTRVTQGIHIKTSMSILRSLIKSGNSYYDLNVYRRFIGQTSVTHKTHNA